MPKLNQEKFNYEASPFWSGLRCRCPQCGKGKLFKSYLKLAPSCTNCGLDMSSAEDADGPAAFGTLFVGLLVAFSALVVEVKFSPPTWVHLSMWIPLAIFGTLGILQPLKGVFVAIQLSHEAIEGTQDNE
ncbi:MAG: DUF983 domain-containing protein [Sphingomonadales bacterium]|nr:DUF983 domain-containing protein [Sphingomonadales bacterium]